MKRKELGVFVYYSIALPVNGGSYNGVMGVITGKAWCFGSFGSWNRRTVGHGINGK